MDRVTKVLVVDDEAGIREMLSLGLAAEGFAVVTAADGQEALRRLEETDPDVVLLDVMLPGLDGWDILPLVRRNNPGRVVVMLTARDAVDDRVRGLIGGADDYMVKPFALRELVARLRAVLRRSHPQEEILTLGPIVLDHDRHRVTVDGREIRLSLREYELLRFFLMNPGRVLSKETLIRRVWGYDFVGDTNVVEVYVRYLRQKLGEEHRDLLRTVRGYGYQLGD